VCNQSTEEIRSYQQRTTFRTTMPRGPVCRKYDGERYRKTLGGYEKCRKRDCPPYEKGEVNCHCCNGPDEFPVNGQWGTWNEWIDDCKNGNIKYRVRTCDNPAPLRNGTLCYSESLGTHSLKFDFEQKQCISGAVIVSPSWLLVGGITIAMFILAIIVMGWMLKQKNRSLRRFWCQNGAAEPLTGPTTDPTRDNNYTTGYTGYGDDDDVNRIMENENPKDNIPEEESQNNMKREEGGHGMSHCTMPNHNLAVPSTFELSRGLSSSSQISRKPSDLILEGGSSTTADSLV